MMSSCVAAAAGKLLSTDAFEDWRLICELADVEPVRTPAHPKDCAVLMRRITTGPRPVASKPREAIDWLEPVR